MKPAKNFFFILTALLLFQCVTAQRIQTRDRNEVVRCVTEERIQQSLQKNPNLIEKWRREGEKRLRELKNQDLMRGQGLDKDTIVIPVVFHLVDEAEALENISDRNIYDQVQMLNEAFRGEKADAYRRVIPVAMYRKTGRIPVRFVLARRTPDGKLTGGIQRRVNKTPGVIDIKYQSTGGLDAWDTKNYLNIWAGTFSGDDANVLGIATPPFYDDLGPQGVVVNLATLPYTTGGSRVLYPTYAEGATLVHEVGHYFYLWHTFGDQNICNNDDFRTVPGWPLPNGAGPEGDDTPPEKYGEFDLIHYGNPSMNYSDGCTTDEAGMMYGSFMNYFDDRALFMFSEGMRKRVIGCIDLYRASLKASNGHVPPGTVRDAYVTGVIPYGSPERRATVTTETPVWVRVMNYGNTPLKNVTLHVQLDNGPATDHPFALSLQPGDDTLLFTKNVAAATGRHTLTIYSDAPNGSTDAFPVNDTLQSFLLVQEANVNAPFTETFTSATFPPPGWQTWSPYPNVTWSRSTATGYGAMGAATVQNFELNGAGQLTELISPAISMGVSDSALLTFRVAYGLYSFTDVSTWDGLEIYVSNDRGRNYQLAYKKTGKYLSSVDKEQKVAFTPGLRHDAEWRRETLNLTPYLRVDSPLIIRFRATNAYGNNLYVDDIAVTPYANVPRDVAPRKLDALPLISCQGSIAPAVEFINYGTQPVRSLSLLSYADGGQPAATAWTGTLATHETGSVTLPPVANLAPGAHTFTVVTRNPNGLPDQNPFNDTLQTTFYVAGRQSLPVAETFSTPDFPPANWLSIPASSRLSWRYSTQRNGSLVLPNSQVNAGGLPGLFISPVIAQDAVYDSIFVKFEHAYFTGQRGTDTLELVVTTDCGQTTTTLWKNWGDGLATTSTGSANYFPKNEDWQTTRIDLMPYVGQKDFQVYWIAKGNGGNNLYLDNIEIVGERVPQLLKDQGYLVYPNPFSNELILRHYEDPDDLMAAVIYNARGQKVWEKRYNGKGFRIMNLQLSHLSRGVYIVHLIYKERKVVEKIVKY